MSASSIIAERDAAYEESLREDERKDAWAARIAELTCEHACACEQACELACEQTPPPSLPPPSPPSLSPSSLRAAGLAYFPSPRQCSATTAKGARCKKMAPAGKDVCCTHERRITLCE